MKTGEFKKRFVKMPKSQQGIVISELEKAKPDDYLTGIEQAVKEVKELIQWCKKWYNSVERLQDFLG